MKTPPNRHNSIREHLNGTGDHSGRFLSSADRHVAIGDLLAGTSLGAGRQQLAGRSILVATRDQLTAAMALIELDGEARRLVIAPPDTTAEQIRSVIETCGVDAVVSDSKLDVPAGILQVACGREITPLAKAETIEGLTTEWVLLSSGTSGAPKMILHTFASLTAPIGPGTGAVGPASVWGTFYDIRRYGGMQIFFRGVLGTGSLVLSSANEPIADHLVRLGALGVTHLSGTPSHWRRALMSPQACAIAPKYIRLSGEIPEQTILNALHSFYPDAAIGHAFASTEAGVAFEVNDGLAGFPASLLGKRGDVEMRIGGNDTLQIRSNRTATRYLDSYHGALAADDGFVDTGDVVELRADRYYFLGRRNGVINVGGLKVYPEEVEAVINRHPAVRMSRVQPRRNAITGALVSAEVVLKEVLASDIGSGGDFKSEILEICRQSLAPHKIPATIRWVPALEVASAGKLVRRHA